AGAEMPRGYRWPRPNAFSGFRIPDEKFSLLPLRRKESAVTGATEVIYRTGVSFENENRSSRRGIPQPHRFVSRPARYRLAIRRPRYAEDRMPMALQRAPSTSGGGIGQPHRVLRAARHGLAVRRPHHAADRITVAFQR